MADPKDTAPKADADVTQVTPNASEPKEPPKADADPVQVPTDNQPAEDGRMKAVEDAVASLTAGMGEIKATLEKLVATDEAVHANVDENPVMGEDEEKKAATVNALTEMADAAHAEVKIVRPVPINSESCPEFKRRILANNLALADPVYAGLATIKADSKVEALLDKAIESIGVNAKKKSDELYKSASSAKNARVELKPGVSCIPNF